MLRAVFGTEGACPRSVRPRQKSRGVRTKMHGIRCYILRYSGSMQRGLDEKLDDDIRDRLRMWHSCHDMGAAAVCGHQSAKGTHPQRSPWKVAPDGNNRSPHIELRKGSRARWRRALR